MPKEKPLFESHKGRYSKLQALLFYWIISQIDNSMLCDPENNRDSIHIMTIDN